jgi:hypothetical protein
MFTRREFLGASVSLALPPLCARSEPSREINCIMLNLVGGPSQIDTWDSKPDAPSDVRGPFRPIATNIPGIRISELFPRMARHADKYSIIRSVHHNGPMTHERARQLLHPTRLSGRPDAILVDVARAPYELANESPRLRDRYGRTRFGQSCLMARRYIERGVGFVAVDMFDTVFNKPSWDIHGCEPFSNFDQMGNAVAPAFDCAYSALLEDLTERGLYQSTIVLAAGEFGRTPRINPLGGRDHHPGVWTMLIGGGPIRGGQIIGASDKLGFEPASRPVTPGDVMATLYRGMGIDRAIGHGWESIGELF